MKKFTLLIQLLYLLFHTGSFGFFFYHSAFLVGEVSITNELSIIEACAMILVVIVFIFADCFVINLFIKKSIHKSVFCTFIIVDSILLMLFVTLSIFFFWFCVSVAIQGQTFFEAIPYIVCSFTIDVVICFVFTFTRLKMVVKHRKKIKDRNTGDGSVSSDKTPE